MFFYMFGLDSENPVAGAKKLAGAGMNAVVAGADRRTVDAVRESGMDAYTCVGAFSLREGSRKCIDADGNERVWFSSSCPCDEESNRRREEEWFRTAGTEGLTGVFIDGARYASPASAEGVEALFTCFCPKCMERMEACGFDPESVRTGVRQWRNGARPLPPKEWLQFRKTVVNETMARFSAVVRSAGSGLRTGAFVFPASLGALVGQTPSALETMDISAPMLYRRYEEPDGPATLNHEYDALVRVCGSENTRTLTGITVPEDVLHRGFPPEALEEETLRACVPSGSLLAPILQLADESLAQSIAAVLRAGAQGAGFFMYNAALLPDLSQF